MMGTYFIRKSCDGSVMQFTFVKNVLNYDESKKKLRGMMEGGNEKSEPGWKGCRGTWLFEGDHFFRNGYRVRDLYYLFDRIRPVHGQIIGGDKQ